MYTHSLSPRLTAFEEKQLLTVSAMINNNLKELSEVYTNAEKEDLLAFRIQLLTAARMKAEEERISNN